LFCTEIIIDELIEIKAYKKAFRAKTGLFTKQLYERPI
jgi:hypothetical protein